MFNGGPVWHESVPACRAEAHHHAAVAAQVAMDRAELRLGDPAVRVGVPHSLTPDVLRLEDKLYPLVAVPVVALSVFLADTVDVLVAVALH